MIPSLNVTLTWFVELGYAIGHGPQMAPGELRVTDDMPINTMKEIAYG